MRTSEEPTFHYVSLNTLVGGGRSLCERLPASGGVYAWFRNLAVQHDDSPDMFVRKIMDAIEARAAPNFNARLGPLHRASLESRSELPDSKIQSLREFSCDPKFRAYLAHILGKASLLQAPLYVGKAQNLQARIADHLKPMSTLSRRLREVGVSLNDCTLAYAEGPQLKAAPEDRERMLLLIEDIVTRTCRPGFVLRPG